MENYKIHTPVLLKEVLDNFHFENKQIYVDATAGFGGHSLAIYDHLKDGTLICLDQDLDSITYLKTKFTSSKNVIIRHCNFDQIKVVLKELGINKVNGILVDLGVSSKMLDDPNRGFSYHHDGPIDMRMDQSQKHNAFYLINHYSQKELTWIFKKYGEVKNANIVALAIVNYRKTQPIQTTKELASIIQSAVSKKVGFTKKHPAKQYFQAIRIAVNDELGHLEKFLKVAPELLTAKGILQIISFHSLEDRMIKQKFNSLVQSQIPKEVPIMDEPKLFKIISKKPITPSQKELFNNRRSRSAKLRVLQKN